MPASLSFVAFTRTITRIVFSPRSTQILRPAVCLDGRSSGRSHLAHGFLGRLHVHPHHFPDVAVRILEAAAVHEAVILLRAGIDACRRPRSALATVPSTSSRLSAEMQISTSLVSRGIGDRLRRELAELVVGQQHHVDGLGKDHAGGGVVA